MRMPRVLTILALLYLMTLGTAWADTFPGGFIEPQGQFVRTKYTAGQIAAFMPATRTAFTFPPPYNTGGVRITQPSDCSGNQDCLFYVGYPYWANLNNHVDSDFIRIFLNFSPSFGGDGPNQFIYDKVTGAIAKIGPLFPPGSPWRTTGDGSTTWYWSGTMPDRIYMLDYVVTVGSPQRKLLRYDVNSSQHEVVFDLALVNFPLGCTAANCPFRLWQAHSSKDDSVHSFTVRNTFNENLGCLVWQPNRTPATRWYPKLPGNSLDECDIDFSGHYTLIREEAPRINRFIDNWNATEFQITNFAHTLGHHSGGFGYFLGLGDPENLPGSVFYYLMNPFGRGPVQFYNPNWELNQMNHVSNLNSINGAPLINQMFCGSNLTFDNQRNEIGCARMDNSRRNLIVAPVMSNASGTGGRFARGVNDGNYGLYPKGNIDVSGRYFIWTSNLSGNRLDAFLVKIPSQQFGGETDINPPAAPSGLTAVVMSAVLGLAPRGFTLTFFDVLESLLLLWSLFKYRARLCAVSVRAYRKAGEAAFTYYWRWKVKRWLKQAPIMLADASNIIEVQSTHYQEQHR